MARRGRPKIIKIRPMSTQIVGLILLATLLAGALASFGVLDITGVIAQIGALGAGLFLLSEAAFFERKRRKRGPLTMITLIVGAIATIVGVLGIAGLDLGGTFATVTGFVDLAVTPLVIIAAVRTEK